MDTARVEFSDNPYIKPTETKQAIIRFITPEGFLCEDRCGIALYRIDADGEESVVNLEIMAGEKLRFVYRVIVEVTAYNHSVVVYIPVNFIG